MIKQQYTVHNDDQQEIAKVKILNPEVLSAGTGLMQFQVVDGWAELEDYCFRRVPIVIQGLTLRIAAFPYQRQATGFLQY